MFFTNVSYNDFVILISAAGKLLGASPLQESDLGSGLSGLMKMLPVFSKDCTTLALGIFISD